MAYQVRGGWVFLGLTPVRAPPYPPQPSDPVPPLPIRPGRGRPPTWHLPATLFGVAAFTLFLSHCKNAAFFFSIHFRTHLCHSHEGAVNNSTSGAFRRPTKCPAGRPEKGIRMHFAQERVDLYSCILIRDVRRAPRSYGCRTEVLSSRSLGAIPRSDPRRLTSLGVASGAPRARRCGALSPLTATCTPSTHPFSGWTPMAHLASAAPPTSSRTAPSMVALPLPT